MINDVRFKNCELLAIKVTTFDKPVILCACYHPPKCAETINSELIKYIKELCKKYKNNPIWLAGDFNLPDIDWTTNSINGSQCSKELNERFLNLFELSKLQQLVDFSTRKDSILDLLFTNRPGFVTFCKAMPGFGDHDTSVLADIVCHPKKIKPIPRTVHLWKQANLDKLRTDIDDGMKIFCATFSKETPINTLWESFKNTIMTAQKENVPTKTTSKRFNQPWFNRECKIAVRRKKRKHSIYKQTKNSRDEHNFKEGAKKARDICNKARRSYIKSAIEQDENGQKSKKLFTFIKHKKTDITGVSPLLDEQGTIQSDDKKLAEILNAQFGSVFSTDDNVTPNIAGQQSPKITEIVFTSEGIKRLLRKINPKKASGPDNIPARLLHTCSEVIADGLVLLFTASFEQGRIPDDWKHANITPLFKGGNKNRSIAENYRPISFNLNNVLS